MHSVNFGRLSTAWNENKDNSILYDYTNGNDGISLKPSTSSTRHSCCKQPSMPTIVQATDECPRKSSTTSAKESRSCQSTSSMRSCSQTSSSTSQKAKAKIFIIQDVLPDLQKAFWRRGWVQKFQPNQLKAKNGKYYKPSAALIFQMYKPGFVWSYTYRNKYEFNDHSPYYSRLIMPSTTSHFSTKVGLTNLYATIYWHYLTRKSKIIYPVSYAITDNTEKRMFIEDFRQTFFTSFLHYLVVAGDELFDELGSLSFNYVLVAMEQVRKAIYLKHHRDIDGNVYEQATPISPAAMSKFREIFHKIRNGIKIKIPNDDKSLTEHMYEMHVLMQKAMSCFPDIPRNGFRNIWILKPSACHCGYGICVLNDEVAIRNMISQNANVTYVAQKYIERPLLIYNTKFDIRQYFLIVMDGRNLSVWMYKNSYFKFSGQEFDLDNLSQSIHITNHTVQITYSNSATRSHLLPSQNTWVLSEFLNYLTSIGRPSVWQDQIYPEIVESLLTIVNAGTDDLVYVKNNFQLFGADYMITDDFHAVLIEINPSPSLAHSTNSTSIVCSALVEDMIKVVVDHRRNEKCATGDFERVWHFEYPQEKTDIELMVYGRGVDRLSKLSKTKCNSDEDKLAAYEKNSRKMPRRPRRPHNKTASEVLVKESRKSLVSASSATSSSSKVMNLKEYEAIRKITENQETVDTKNSVFIHFSLAPQ